MKLYRQKIWNQKYSEKLFVAPQQGIAPQGMSTVNRYTPKIEYIDTKIVPEGASAFIGHKNPNIGSDINTVRKKLRRKFESMGRYSKHRTNNELPYMYLNERTGIYKQFNNGERYVQPTTEEYITASDTVCNSKYRGKRILRIDAIDPISSKVAGFPKYKDYLGEDSGEVLLSKKKELGKDALISVPKDSGFNRYIDEVFDYKTIKDKKIEERRKQLREKFKMWYGQNQENKNSIKVKPDDKRFRRLLKRNHRLVNGLDRSTLEFMYGTKNPNIEKMIKNAKRIL